MGRSSRSQADENRARIVEVASGLFREHGIEAVSIVDVMKASGMTQGGFYRHFASKDALAAEACTLAFSRSVENWRHAATEAAREGRRGPAGIAAYYFVRRALDKTCPMIALAADAASRRRNSLLSRAYEAGVKRLFETFSEAAAGTAVSEDELRIVFTAMIGSNLLARAMGGGEWIDTFKRTVTDAAAA